MNILFFDNDRAWANRMQSALANRFREIGQSCLCVAMTDLDVLLLTDLSLFQAIFLCIDIPGLNGMDIAIAVRKRYPTVLLILVSSELAQAPNGYFVNAFRFVLKEKMEDGFVACVDEVARTILQREGLIKIKDKDGWRRIKLTDILYIEGSSNRKVYFHMAPSEIVEANGRLADYTENLRGQGFLRIQRGYLVNMCHIIEMKNYLVILDNGETLKASVQYYSEVRSQYIRWSEERGQI